MKRFSLWLSACLFLWTGSARADVDSLSSWENLPALENGRVMPLDSFARNTLLGFSGKSTFNRQPAARWLARILFTPDECKNDAIFLVDNPEVVEALGLSAEGRGRYSFVQLEPMLADLTRLARAAYGKESADRTPVDNEFMRLLNNVSTYRRLSEGFAFAIPRPEFDLHDEALSRDLNWPAEGVCTLVDARARLGRITELMGKTDTSAAYQAELRRISAVIRAWSQRGSDAPPAIIPARNAKSAQPWIGPAAALMQATKDDAFSLEVKAINEMAMAFRAGNQSDFDAAARRFASSIRERAPAEALWKNLRREVVYNRADAFYRTELLYGFGFLLALLSVPFRNKWLYRPSAVLLALGLIPHSYGIIARMIIMGRPPVTNLYTTFIFVSWTCALLGLAVEYLQRNRLGLITAGSMGLALLMTSARFGSDGDTMGVMVAVLDSNFWLATHVVTISIGYAGCCAAGLLGHIYLLQALRRDPDNPALKETDRAVYGAQAFGLIFSFLGTMLGGVWADQSWGRFWGWDPKENGALVIVLWSAVLFHARVGRMIGPRGFAAGSVIGILAVLLAWLGVNLLGVGLHSYGFTSGIARGLAITCAIEVAFVLLVTPFSARKPEAPSAEGRG